MTDIAKKATSALEDREPVWEYADAPESTNIVKLEPRYGLFIGGEFVDPKSGSWFETINPATEGTLAEVADAGPEDVDLAVRTARKASKDRWRKLPGSERAKYLYRIARQLQERAREFAVLETMNGGKPIKESRDVDLPLAAAHFFYYAGWADKLDYAFPNRSPKPIGVAGQIIPWNFPLLMAAWKIAPALATGNTVVLKPAELTPLSSLRLAELALEAGIPEDVVNVVVGPGRVVGQRLVEHPHVAKIGFTGSTEVGQQVMQGAAGHIKRVTLELGGKSANVIFEDADLERAAAAAPYAVFDNAGQDCCARSRILVQRSVYDRFVGLLIEATAAVKVGDPAEEATEMGPLVSAEHRDKVASFVDGQPLFQGDVPDGAGYWFPCTLVEATNDDRVAREEVFGPVAALIPFTDEADAIRLANDTPFGLSGSIWTRDGARALRVARAIDTGVLSINSNSSVRVQTPFGGFKQSGFGRELGMQALEGYSEVKTVFYSTEP